MRVSGRFLVFKNRPETEVPIWIQHINIIYYYTCTTKCQGFLLNIRTFMSTENAILACCNKSDKLKIITEFGKLSNETHILRICLFCMDRELPI